MRKAFKLLSIAIAAYNLYILVDDFLDTPQGQKLKDKALEYAEKAKPYIEEASEYATDLAEKVADRVEAKNIVTE